MHGMRWCWRRMRVRVVGAVGLLALAACSVGISAQGVAPVPAIEPWWQDLLTVPNVLLVAGALVHFGIILRQARETREDLDDLRAWKQSDVPATYARKDVIQTTLTDIDRRLTSIEQTLSHL